MLNLSCEAPRNNPFDPRADNYSPKFQATITVRHLYPPYSGIEGVDVLSKSLNLYSQSDARGKVVWSFNKVDSVTIRCEKQGYFPSVVTFYPQGMQDDWDVYLNSKPYLKNTRFYSLKNNATDETLLEMKALIGDGDGIVDITAVYLYAPKYSFRDSLMLDIDNGFFVVTFDKQNLNSSLTDATIPEIEFWLIIKNTNGDSVVTGPYNIKRVINTNLTPLLPNPDRPESGTIRFTWQKVNLDFDFHYKLILYRWGVVTKKIVEYDSIPSDSTQYILDDPEVLNAMDQDWYLWILQVEDNLGDIAQSYGLSFQYIK